MPNGKTAVTAHFDNEEARQLRRYMDRKGLESKGNAVRKLAVASLRERDPRNSWLLYIGLAAVLWSMLSVVGAIRFGEPYGEVSLFSFLFAGMALTGYTMQLVHSYGFSGLPLVRRWFGRPV